MADVKISELEETTDIYDDDIIPVVLTDIAHADTNVTKKISWQTIKEKILNDVYMLGKGTELESGTNLNDLDIRSLL